MPHSAWVFTAALAQPRAMEMTVAIEEWLKRIPDSD